MSQVSIAAPHCDRNPRNCKMLVRQAEDHAARCVDAGITSSDAVINAMAVGLVIEVWRNSPVEDMHASSRGPSDAAMFAESTTLHTEAVNALTATNRSFGLIDFEKLLLDRKRVWAGTDGKPLKDLGRGFLGHYDRHVKDRTNSLIGLTGHTCVTDPLQVYLIPKALMFGRDHKGMPCWPVIVERIGILLANPNHPAWREKERGAQALAEAPVGLPSIDHLTTALLTAPSTLPTEILEWLSDHFLYCAAPPYARGPWDGASSTTPTTERAVTTERQPNGTT
jgi:hypothetical protein